MGIDDPGNNPGRPENKGSDDAKATDEKDAEASDANDDDADNSVQSVGTDTSDNSRHNMARSEQS